MQIERLERLTKRIDSLGIKESKNNARNIDIIADKNIEQGKNKMIKIEVLAENKYKKAYDLRSDALKTLKTIRKPITNKHDGRVAIVNKAGRLKMTSDEAVRESVKHGFTAAEHIEVAKHIQELYEEAKLREIQPDLKHGHTSVQIPRYEVMFDLNGLQVQALITLKETLKGIYKGNRIYSIELESIARLKPTEP